MISNEIISDYMMSNLLWYNKETIPVIQIKKVQESDMFLKIEHDILFKTSHSDKLNKYLTGISCTIMITDVKKYLREKNLNSIL